MFYAVQLAPHDAAWFNWGDPAGLVGDDPQREGRPHSVLRQKDALWSYDHDRAFAEYYASREVRAENAPDPRSLGLMFFTSYEDPDTAIRRIERAGIDAFEVGRQDGLQVVTARTQQGDLTWWLDPARDNQPVRVTLQRDGRLRREARIDLEQIDGVWFPVHVETIGYTPEGGEQSHDVSEVFYAEFNRPDHPDHLTPGDIGIEAGTLVTRYPSEKGSEALVWDGRQLVPFSQYRGTFPHQRDADAAAVAPRAGLSFDAQIRRKLSAREAYTRDFIARHKLDRSRAGRAGLALAARVPAAGAPADWRHPAPSEAAQAVVIRYGGFAVSARPAGRSAHESAWWHLRATAQAAAATAAHPRRTPGRAAEAAPTVRLTLDRPLTVARRFLYLP